MSYFSRAHAKRLHAIPHPWRMLTGIVLILGGILGFLPVLGFWMIPLGLLVLSADFKWARRLHVNLMLGWRSLRRRYARLREGS